MAAVTDASQGCTATCPRSAEVVTTASSSCITSHAVGTSGASARHRSTVARRKHEMIHGPPSGPRSASSASTSIATWSAGSKSGSTSLFLISMLTVAPRTGVERRAEGRDVARKVTERCLDDRPTVGEERVMVDHERRRLAFAWRRARCRRRPAQRPAGRPPRCSPAPASMPLGGRSRPPHAHGTPLSLRRWSPKFRPSGASSRARRSSRS